MPPIAGSSKTFDMRNFRTLRRLFFRFMDLSLNDQLFIIRVVLLLILLRISLKLIPFHVLYFIIKFFLHKTAYSFTEHLKYTNRVIWAVETLGRYLLRTKCLAQALAVHILLNRKGIDNSIRIGFIKNKNRLSAHAWIKAGETILTGASQNLPFYFNIPIKA